MPNSLRDTDLIPLHAWLIEAGTNDVAAALLFDGFCGRLVAAGVPIARGFLSISGLHPLRRAYSLTWHDGRIVEATDFGHATMATPLWHNSPFRHMLETKTRRLHRWLVGDDAVLDFEVLREFRDAGMSEWLALKGNTAPAAAHDLLAAYLGDDAADRVSAGQVQRGSVSRIAAAILCADVRGFTNFAEETAPEEVTRRLNGIFDCLGDPVRAAGGEILKFLGDGVLAVFLPSDSANMAIVTPAALAAAREILARVEALNATA